MTFRDWLWGLEQDAPGLSLSWVDAGMVPLQMRGELVITDKDLIWATPEQLDALHTFELYSNQWYLIEEHRPSGDRVIRWKFTTPCITTLKEES